LDTTTSVVATSVIVVTGQWAKNNKGPSIKLVVGGMVLAVMLSIMSNGNEKLASQFGTAILVGAALTYVIPISKKLGFSK
jgi:hypothetical protein